jgi:O-antigen/teichoic acid export membrane protein
VPAANPNEAIRRKRVGTSAMLVGAAASVVGAYGYQVIGGRALGAEGFAPVSVVWTVLFLGFTVFLLPVEQLVIRRVTLAGGEAASARRSLRAIIAVVGAVTLGGVGFALAVRQSLLGDDIAYVVVMGAMFPVYGVYAVGRGMLAGAGRFAAYGSVVVSDAGFRLAGAAAVAVTGRGAVALTWVLVLAPLVVVAFRPLRRAANPEQGVVADAGSDRRFLSGYVVATAASQTILAAGPLVVGALGASAASISVFFVTNSLFRGPISASYNVLARVLPSVTRRSAEGGDAAINRLVGRAALFAAVAIAAGGGAGATVGPWIVEVLYGSEFRPGPALAGLSAAAVVAGLLALLTSQVLVGRGQTGRLAAVWVAALAVAAVTVGLVGGEETVRVAAAFLAGEVVALVGLTASVLWRVRPHRPGG